METDTGRHVDEGFQSFASVKIVAVVDEEGNLLEGSGVQTVTKADTDDVILFDGDTIDENACPAHIFANEETVFIDEGIGDLLFLLLLLCRKGFRQATRRL